MYEIMDICRVLFAALLQKLFGESDLVVSMYQDAAV